MLLIDSIIAVNSIFVKYNEVVIQELENHLQQAVHRLNVLCSMSNEDFSRGDEGHDI